MLTEQDLQGAMAEAVEDPAAEKFMLGLSDRALAEAGAGTWWRRPMAGKRGKLIPGIAVGSAFALAAAVGVVALGGHGSGAGSPATLAAPDMPANPVAQDGLIEFGVECFGHKPLDRSYVWDPATQQYRAVAGTTTTSFQASPDGKQALVLHGGSVLGGFSPDPTGSWAVANWSDAVAGHMTYHPIADQTGVQWTSDGKEVVSRLAWDVIKETGGETLRNKTADFFDPLSGRFLASVPIPQQVLAGAASGQWSVQQWQGDHDSVLFPLLSVAGDRLEYLNAQGVTVKTLTLQEGLPGYALKPAQPTETAEISPDGGYLVEASGGTVAVFDLKAGGKRVGFTDVSGSSAFGWIGDHQLVTATDENLRTYGSRGDQIAPTGHSPIIKVLSPELEIMQQARFVLPADPRGACSTWPMSWAPAGQFPGAFVP